MAALGAGTLNVYELCYPLLFWHQWQKFLYFDEQKYSNLLLSYIKLHKLYVHI
jgi:hypothetical protein